MSHWTRYTLIVAACSICVGLAPSAWAQKDKPTCAVLTLDAKGGISQEESALLTDRFAAEFDKLGRYQILNRSKMKEILDQQNFARSESCSAAECAVEAGKLLAAQKMIYGTVGKFGELYTVNTCLIDVETGSQERSGTSDFRGPKEDVLTVLMAANAHKLLGLKPPSEALQSKDVIVTQPVPRYQADYAPPMNARDDYAPARRRSQEPEPEPEAAYLGICGWSETVDEEDDESDSKDSFIGAGIGYRWRGGTGWDFTLGSGIGRIDEGFEGEDGESTDSLDPVIDLAFGYSF
jgi:hypothetical protein